ncbi:3'-5' RNA exonuclease complex component [Madurella fahalii]|uniref:3'-5' RNA exonuclease complex component n=1 Tax=Madurella fahalii TaxID=1157608 RepID=A0ABQ0G056_9PEZI
MMRRTGRQNYVCWRCLNLRPAGTALRRASAPATASWSAVTAPSVPSSAFRLPIRSLTTAIRSSARENRIREQLRQWEAENPSPTRIGLADDTPGSGIFNSMSRVRSERSFKLDLFSEDDDATVHTHFDGVDVVDLGLNSQVLDAGDLVEVSSGQLRIRLLAICLGKYNGHDHFYTNTGKWFTSRNFRSGFVIKRFIDDPAELQAVIDAIPSVSPSSTVLNELQDLNIGPSRDLAASLIRKMYAFQSAARLIHQTYVERLSRAHTRLGDDEKLMSLREIADLLLPASLKRNGTSFPPEALYAVYSVIYQDDIAFEILQRGARHHESYLVFVQSAFERTNVYQVEHLVRNFWEHRCGRGDTSAPQARAFGMFLDHARNVIDQAREDRSWSPHGMTGPSRRARRVDSEPFAIQTHPWSETSLMIIRFMQHWAASGGFPASSRCHWIGASILRALGRYENAMLDNTTGWTFLQEIGWIPPWDVSARHYLRLPEAKLDRHPGVSPDQADAPAITLEPDQLAHLRQDFARSTVYCIDSADTLDVDDGISLEEAGDGEYWVHIHVADPASRIRPGSAWAEQAGVRCQTSYLTGFYQRMFDHDDIREAFSLGPNQPTLTFSARVTDEGRLVDYKVTPGSLRDVVYITPGDVSSVCGDGDSSSDLPYQVLEVGTRPAAATATTETRKMAKPYELSRRQRDELKTLSRLAKALQRARIDNGAVPAFPPRAAARVSLDGVVPMTTTEGSVHYRGDPYIRVSYQGQGSALVSSLMQLAGEVAARWCYERSIPIPYRVSLLSAQNADAFRAFTRDVFYPKLLAGQTPPAEDFHTLMALVGGFDISSVPAPQVLMGLDLYTKVTSPLRRYPDLLVHWQIEAALLEEHRRGESLATKTSPGQSASEKKPARAAEKKRDAPSFLPFDKRYLEESVFPRMRVRERHGKLLDNNIGNNQWILQALVRAWRFGEGSSQILRTFRFTASEVMLRHSIRGRLDWFDLRAVVELEHMNDVVLMADVKPGDVFRVELANVNVHANKVYVRLLEKVE